MKQPRREPSSGVPSSRSNISRAMRGPIPKISNVPAIRNQQNEDQAVPHSEQAVTPAFNLFVSPTTSRTRSPCKAKRTCLCQEPP